MHVLHTVCNHSQGRLQCIEAVAKITKSGDDVASIWVSEIVRDEMGGIDTSFRPDPHQRKRSRP